MRPVYYDFHIHTALSPCADNDMTPNDIVGMAILGGLDAIAITDHNTIGNVAAVIKAAENAEKQHGRPLLVLPGIEVSTAEEVHVLCLFADIEDAISFDADLSSFYSIMPNREDIFGSQIIFNENDEKIKVMERMLIAPTSISFDSLHALTDEHNGAFIPAHIDRDSFSVISNLGFLPPHLKIKTVEVTQKGIEKNNNTYTDNFSKHNIITSSDAHQLWTINDKENFIQLPEVSANLIIDFLR
ncbi:MAG: PHP domain-containing protein [Oscillospiraceae bacterium]|jgi:PHP family Zn ribbon phosphoesterase|nr:PHP domain-containing protein [Oscillospiraceae bacterium]